MYVEARNVIGFYGMGPFVGSLAGLQANPGSVRGMNFEQGLGAHIEQRLEELYAEVRLLLDENRWFVSAIAHALEQFLTITGEDIDAIFRGVRGPTVDGAIYRSEWFAREYSAYINAAFSAHQSHDPLLFPLPKASVNGSSNGLHSDGNGTNGQDAQTNGHH